MATNLLKTIAERVEPDSLINYLKFSGWAEDESVTEKWLVFHGYTDINGRPLEIALPRDRSAYDYLNYISAILELLVAINKDTSIEVTLRRIKYYMSDLLSVRNVEKFYDSLPLNLASKQIHGLATLVKHAVDLEKSQLPYFLGQSSKEANDMSRRIKFGHTFHGSFGFTIEFPIEQMPLSDGPKNVVLPLGRRIMERIIRGLTIARQAVEESNVDTLVDGYKDGFNGNMCNAISEMFDNEMAPIEYNVLWSPIIVASEDVRVIESVSLNERSHAYLVEAGQKMKRMVEQKPVLVQGRVITIHTTDNPLASQSEREIIIKWSNREENGRALRPVQITLPISADDYEIAHRAQKEWRTVAVDGDAQYIGAKWVLNNPRNMRFLDEQQKAEEE